MPVMSSLAESLSLLPEADRQRAIGSLTEGQAQQLLYDWRFWGRPKQLAPEGDWLTWLILAGRGFGKTRTGAEWVRECVCGPTPLAKGRFSRIALVAETAADARDVMVEGPAGLLAVHPKDFRPHYEPSNRRLVWPNGAIATTFNAVEPDQLRGPQHDAAWGDELAKWRYARETWDQLQFGLRLGTNPQQVVTTTPRPIAVLKEIMGDPGTVITRGSTFDNRSNLAPKFFESVVARYEGTRLGRQELNAEVLDDAPGALWTRAMLEAARIAQAPEMQRVVVAVDPSGASGEDDGDQIGIVVAGLGVDGIGYLLADRTIAASPSVWGRRVVAAYGEFGASRVVAERNFGGAMVEHVIRTAGQGIAYKEVTASRGKMVRAEPIAALYEQNRIRHVGAFPELEDQLAAMTTTGYLGAGSPDRADALVWAFTELFPSIVQVVKPKPKIVRLVEPVHGSTGWMS
jgi:phage terminase large subunit-like protein